MQHSQDSVFFSFSISSKVAHAHLHIHTNTPYSRGMVRRSVPATFRRGSADRSTSSSPPHFYPIDPTSTRQKTRIHNTQGILITYYGQQEANLFLLGNYYPTSIVLILLQCSLARGDKERERPCKKQNKPTAKSFRFHHLDHQLISMFFFFFFFLMHKKRKSHLLRNIPKCKCILHTVGNDNEGTKHIISRQTARATLVFTSQLASYAS